MARISQIQRGVVRNDERLSAYAALLGMLVVLDAYSLEKSNGKVTLTVWKEIYKKQFVAADEFSIVQPVGNWLCSLPKTIWNQQSTIKN